MIIKYNVLARHLLRIVETGLTALKARHVAAGGAPVHVNTLTGVLKRAGFVWKRTRHSLKKSATTQNLPKHNSRLAP